MGKTKHFSIIKKILPFLHILPVLERILGLLWGPVAEKLSSLISSVKRVFNNICGNIFSTVIARGGGTFIQNSLVITDLFFLLIFSVKNYNKT